MPNHLTTVCTVTGPDVDVARFRAAHILKDGDEASLFFSLDSVIPMPACVKGTESGTEADEGFFALTGLHPVSFARFTETPMHRAARRAVSPFPLTILSTPEDFLVWLTEHNPAAVEKGRRSLACFRETGFRNWYDWSYENWGTEWDSYDYEERSGEPGKFVFQFDTANGKPEPVFAKLVELYPGLVFDLVTIDEGGPEFEGRYCVDVKQWNEAEPSAERYRLVYGRDPYSDDDGDV